MVNGGVNDRKQQQKQKKKEVDGRGTTRGPSVYLWDWVESNDDQGHFCQYKSHSVVSELIVQGSRRCVCCCLIEAINAKPTSGMPQWKMMRCEGARACFLSLFSISELLFVACCLLLVCLLVCLLRRKKDGNQKPTDRNLSYKQANKAKKMKKK